MTSGSLDLPYLAAVIDTMASLSTRSVRQKTVLPVVAVHGPNVPLLEYLAKHTGVEAHEIRRAYAKSPCSQHCDEPHVHIQSVSGRWQVTGARATCLLHTIAPYTHLRTGEIESLVKIGTQAPIKPATAAKMVALGWRVPVFNCMPDDPWKPESQIERTLRAV